MPPTLKGFAIQYCVIVGSIHNLVTGLLKIPVDVLTVTTLTIPSDPVNIYVILPSVQCKGGAYSSLIIISASCFMLSTSFFYSILNVSEALLCIQLSIFSKIPVVISVKTEIWTIYYLVRTLGQKSMLVVFRSGNDSELEL